MYPCYNKSYVVVKRDENLRLPIEDKISLFLLVSDQGVRLETQPILVWRQQGQPGTIMNFVKSPPPRPLSQKETLDSLNHWKTIFRNYYRRDSSFKQFLKSDCQWDFKQPNYALAQLDDEAPAERAEDLGDFLSNLSGFLPHSYLTQKILEDTTCLQDCWDIIYEHYNVQITPETLLDFESLKKEPAENYRQFYERLLQHVRLHLAPDGAKAENLTNARADTMSISLMNLVALQWLRKCHPQLVNIVRTEYCTELRRGDQLAALVSKIAPNIESLLSRHAVGNVNMVKQDVEDDYIHEVKYVRPSRGGRNGSGNRGRAGGKNTRAENLFCPGCFALSKELKVSIDFKHRPAMCPRTHAVAKFLQADTGDEYDDDEDVLNAEDFEEDGKESSNIKYITELSPLQSSPILATCRAGNVTDLVPSFNFNKNVQHDKIKPIQASNKMPFLRDHLPNVSDKNLEGDDKLETVVRQVRNLEERRHLWSNKVRKETSPRVKALINQLSFDPVIDEGSEVNCVDEKFINLNSIKSIPTPCSASSADSTKMEVVGQTKDDLVITIMHNNPVMWNLGRCVVVKNLSVDMLIGEPGKVDNKIITLPHLRKVKTEDINGQTIVLNYSNKNTERHLCKVNAGEVLLEGESLRYKLPPHLEAEPVVAISPIRGNKTSWIDPEILPVVMGHVEIENKSLRPVFLKRKAPFADMVNLIDVEVVKNANVNKVLEKQEDYTHLNPPTILTKDDNYLEQIVIDPDNQLNDEWKKKFKDLCRRFSDTINPNPGRYNGYYGEIDNSLDFISTPPPAIKARLPNYSADKMKIMAQLMDKLETMGVLAKPEEKGVVPAFVVPSLLQPKPEKGEWRLVSDFTPLNIHIRKYQNVAPTIQDAKKILAKYKYNIECDLSHCFFQGGMRKEDIQYLATPHPYKGLRVYCVEPQGLRNASEHAYERLARIFGDLCMEEKMTRMADGLYIVADTVTDLFNNFCTVLSRARNAGLTFKPKKIVIAPRETVLFGWKKSDDGWKPTEHTISPLTKAEEPVTVKQLRSFIGSLKQLTECIKDYAILLNPLEVAVAGKASAERILWTQDLSDNFKRAKAALDNIETIFVAKPSDKLDVFTDFSESAKAVGGRLMITRKNDEGSTRTLLGGHFSCKLNLHQKNWLPCEGEALGVRLLAKHFSPIIMENAGTTTIHTDNLPTVHAWKRMKTGAFSTSARVASFLTGLSALRVEIVHRPGKKLLVSDYNSRHPNSCAEKKCKICQFAFHLQKTGDEAVPMVCSVSVSDIENGSVRMPFTQRAAWTKVQTEDKVHKMLFKLIETSGTPERKKTKGDFTRLKRLHNLYRTGQLKIDSDGLVTVLHNDAAGNQTKAISVPHNFFPGLVHSLHLKLKHPSKAQMLRLVTRYFYCSGHTRIINDVVSNCELCRSLQELPKELFSESSDPTPKFGKNFSADIIKKDGQLIFICREKLSQYTFSKFIVDETADSLRDGIVTAVLELMPEEGAVVQVDCAPGLQTLAAESKMDGSILKKLGIFVDIGRTLNKNKNPIAENCIKEFHKERLRLNIPPGRLSEIDRAVVTKNMNARIRGRGFTAKEIAFNRDQVNNCLKPVSDDQLSSEQIKKRQDRHNKPKKKEENDAIEIGDDVYVKEDKSKQRGREKYKVVKLFEKKDEKWAVVQKNNSKFMAKEYEVKVAEIFPVLKNKSRVESSDEETKKAVEAQNPRAKIYGFFYFSNVFYQFYLAFDPTLVK